jgi:hypothetical protein
VVSAGATTPRLSKSEVYLHTKTRESVHSLPDIAIAVDALDLKQRSSNGLKRKEYLVNVNIDGRTGDNTGVVFISAVITSMVGIVEIGKAGDLFVVLEDEQRGRMGRRRFVVDVTHEPVQFVLHHVADGEVARQI